MARFLLTYKGDATDPTDMAAEEREAVMQQWAEWMQRAGSAIVDIGTPLAPQGSMVDDGTSGTPTALSGYTIIEASDLEAARSVCDGHPFLSEGKGDFAIDLYEMLPVPM